MIYMKSSSAMSMSMSMVEHECDPVALLHIELQTDHLLHHTA